MPRITNASDARKNCENGFLHLPKHRFSRIFIEVLKIAENLEKQSFTFFAFLPPYIGVSGSLVSRMRKISMRSIDWYQKFLISRLAARHSTVFVLRHQKRSPGLKTEENHPSDPHTTCRPKNGGEPFFQISHDTSKRSERPDYGSVANSIVGNRFLHYYETQRRPNAEPLGVPGTLDDTVR